jgi:hypothetical protein
MQGDPDLYRPVIDALADQPRSFRELARLTGVPDPKLLQALTLLVSNGHAHPLPEGEDAGVSEAAVRFNRALASGIVIEDGPYYVAAGLAGTAVRASLPELLALDLAAQKSSDVKVAATRGWEMMSRTGARLQRDGQALMDQASNEAELARRIEVFNRDKLPLFRRLGVI